MPPARGQILDDTGRPLVTSRPSIVVTVNRAELSRQGDGGLAELHRLAALLGIRFRLLRDRLRLCTAGVPQPCWAGSPYQPIPVREDVTERVGVQIMENQPRFPGVVAQVQPVVSYPGGTSAAQVLGYLQPVTAEEQRQRHLTPTGFAAVDLAGQSGLEARYDAEMRGTAGARRVAVNAAGAVTGTISATSPVAGDNLVTSLNSGVQADAERALAGAIHRAHAEGNLGATTGAAVVMTTSGRVVAMASYPSYNPRIWTRGIIRAAVREAVWRRRWRAGPEPGHAGSSTRRDPPGRSPRPRPPSRPATPWLARTTALGRCGISGRTFFNDNPANSGRDEHAHRPRPVLRHGLLRARLRDLAAR